VAGGSAIGLLLISGGADRSERLYKLYRADLWEKAAVVGFLLVALVSLVGLDPAAGRFGSLLSGGWIPLLNLLVALKVTLGSWAMVQRLVRHRGLL
jgi:multicomponent Na+:H+ antiporter subunit B